MKKSLIIIFILTVFFLLLIMIGNIYADEDLNISVKYKINENYTSDIPVLITIDSNNGIEYVKTQDIKIDCNKKKKLCIDREISNKTEYILTVKLVGKSEKNIIY